MTFNLNHIRRYELKYTISEHTAAAIREYVRPMFELDSHVAPGQSGYVVNNLYLDTPDLRFYYDVKFRRYTRFKPRVRYYGNRPQDRLWLELKYKQNSIVWKNRRPIPLEMWPAIIEKPSFQPVCPVKINQGSSFEDAVHLYGAQPILHVRYVREPWVSTIDYYGRVTFDRRLSCRMAHASFELGSHDREMLLYDDASTTRAEESPVILEIKVETSVPRWTIDLIRRFELLQRGFSKYCYVIDRSSELLAGPRYCALAR